MGRTILAIILSIILEKHRITLYNCVIVMIVQLKQKTVYSTVTNDACDSQYLTDQIEVMIWFLDKPQQVACV